MNDHPPPRTESARPTLKTIAEATGFAVATVSRALKDASDIGEETKRRVREAAERLGYRQNRAAVRLRTGKTSVIALVLSAEADVMNHTAKLIYSIAETLRGTGYHLVVMPYFTDQDPMDPIRYIVETESADGIILNQTEPGDARIRYLMERGFPFATHGRSDMDAAHPFFDYDNDAFGTLAVRALVARGRSRICMIAPPRHHMYSRHMITGARTQAAISGVRFEVLETCTSDTPADLIEAAVAEHMRQPEPPDALISGSTNGAMAAITGAEGVGLTIGKDFDLVSKEAFNFLHRFRREVIVGREDVGRAGSFLASAVMAAIEGRAPELAQELQIPTLSDFRIGT